MVAILDEKSNIFFLCQSISAYRLIKAIEAIEGFLKHSLYAKFKN